MEEVTQLTLSLLTLAIIFGLTNFVAIVLLISFGYQITTLGFAYVALAILFRYIPRY